MKKVVAFTPCDHSPNNEMFFKQLENSLRKFHSEEELPLLRFDLENIQDKDKWYKATPLIAKDLINEYETVIKLDADQIITGDLSTLWSDEKYDVGLVLNDPEYRIQTWDIEPYFNNGLVVMKSKEFVEHWNRLCHTNHINMYQFREQDLLNIMASDYMNYKVKILDTFDGIYGEYAKPFWPTAYINGEKLMVKINDSDQELKVIHFGGGNSPDKGNYKIRFSEEVVKRIDELIK
jgi:lipopolysaccharide biosynthesis glycosyltransferase